nr:GntR family transcriptional regulator [Virgibacillus sp. LDC-1]
MSMSPKQKVYQEVLKEIRSFIDEHNLQSGDKLPSERELAEKLNAGRSSVREALRAMELLGLIETKHGEGTFLSTYRPYQTVELLSSFILRDNVTKHDLICAKLVLEKETAKLAFSRLTTDDLAALLQIVDMDGDEKQKHLDFFFLLFEKTENLLLAKIWRLMEEFSHTMDRIYYDVSFYKELLTIYTNNEYEAIEQLFTSMLKKERCC